MQLDPLVVVCLFITVALFPSPLQPGLGLPVKGQLSRVGFSRVKILETASRFHRSAPQLAPGLNTSVCLLSEGGTARHKGLATTTTTVSPVTAALDANVQVGSLVFHLTVCCLFRQSHQWQ